MGDAMPDMWYLDGTWQSNETQESRLFEKMMTAQNAREVMRDVTKGVEITLRGDEEVHAAGISFKDGRIFVRRLQKKLSEIKEENKKSQSPWLIRFFRTP